jgi:hypothetical protein
MPHVAAAPPLPGRTSRPAVASPATAAVTRPAAPRTAPCRETLREAEAQRALAELFPHLQPDAMRAIQALFPLAQPAPAHDAAAH